MSVDSSRWRWWQRVNLQIEVSWRIFGGRDLVSWSSFRRWLFKCDSNYVRQYHDYPVWWVYLNVQVFGLLVGGGIFISLAGVGEVPEGER